MTDQSVFSRISNWFKTSSESSTLPLENEHAVLSRASGEPDAPVQVTTFLKPWAKRDATLAQLQEGFNTLNELVASVKDNLDRQAERHDQLLQVLQHLPPALLAIPENSRVQTETLRAVGEQMSKHNSHYQRLAEVLEKVSDASGDQKRSLEAISDRVDVISRHDQSIAEGMRSVSSALEGVSQNTQTSAQVLDQLKNNARTRDLEIQWILRRQSTRFTIMLSAAIVLSVTALAAVGLIGWRLIIK